MVELQHHKMCSDIRTHPVKVTLVSLVFVKANDPIVSTDLIHQTNKTIRFQNRNKVY